VTTGAAWSINSAGQIVGNWYDSDFKTHGFLAQPGKKGKP
jgi:probable HAF family extracellular repeat protein